jgi:GTPase
VLDNARKQAEERKTGFSSDLLMNEFREYLEQELTFLDYAPMAFITARDGRNVQSLIDLAQHLYNQANERVGTGRLNAAVKQIFEERTPSTPRGERVRVYYATQTDVAPPTLVLFVNKPDFVSDSYRRFMVNRFRELLPYDEVPIKLIFRGRVRGAEGQGTDEPIAEGGGTRPVKPQPKARARTTSRRPEPKPHPKKAARRGPARGTRPK